MLGLAMFERFIECGSKDQCHNRDILFVREKKTQLYFMNVYDELSNQCFRLNIRFRLWELPSCFSKN